MADAHELRIVREREKGKRGRGRETEREKGERERREEGEKEEGEGVFHRHSFFLFLSSALSSESDDLFDVLLSCLFSSSSSSSIQDIIVFNEFLVHLSKGFFSINPRNFNYIRL